MLSGYSIRATKDVKRKLESLRFTEWVLMCHSNPGPSVALGPDGQGSRPEEGDISRTQGQGPGDYDLKVSSELKRERVLLHRSRVQDLVLFGPKLRVELVQERHTGPDFVRCPRRQRNILPVTSVQIVLLLYSVVRISRPEIPVTLCPKVHAGGGER